MFLPEGQPGPEWRLFEFDPQTGKTVWMVIEPGQGGKDRIRVRTVMPIDNLLEENAALRADAPADWAGDMHLVARTPMHVWARELAPAIQQEDDKYVSRWLNNSDYAKFRTKGGKV